jgi:uncharacterized lipoprotein YajG
MWKDVSKMTREEIIEELEALKQVRELSAKVSIDKLLKKELDFGPLEKVNFTMTANGALYRRVKGFLPELMEKMYNDRVIFKKKMLVAKKKLEEIESEMRRRGII